METSQKEIKLTIAAGKWSPWAERELQHALPYAPVDDLRRQVEEHRARLFYVRYQKKRIACYVLRIDGNEGVIVAAAGAFNDPVREGEVSLVKALLHHVERQFKNVWAVRIHTARAGLVRRLSAAGYQPQEFVMRKPCAN